MAANFWGSNHRCNLVTEEEVRMCIGLSKTGTPGCSASDKGTLFAVQQGAQVAAHEGYRQPHLTSATRLLLHQNFRDGARAENCTTACGNYSLLLLPQVLSQIFNGPT